MHGSRLQAAEPEPQQAASGGDGPSSPIRVAIERRAAAQRQKTARTDNTARGAKLLRLLGSTLHMALAGAVSAAAVVTVSAVRRSRLACRHSYPLAGVDSRSPFLCRKLH